MSGKIAMIAVALFPATLAAFAADAFSQSRPAPVDVKACLHDARLTIDRLKPAAEVVLGKPIDIEAPSMMDIYSSSGSRSGNPDQGITYAARVVGKEIRIAEAFCRASEGFRLAIMAHELGHVIDDAAGTVPAAGSPDWNTDPREISATRRAGEILRAAGLSMHYLAEALPAEHLERAGILRRKAIPQR